MTFYKSNRRVKLPASVSPESGVVVMVAASLIFLGTASEGERGENAGAVRTENQFRKINPSGLLLWKCGVILCSRQSCVRI